MVMACWERNPQVVAVVEGMHNEFFIDETWYSIIHGFVSKCK
jgi:hypothetical protein